jgi:hypothetical protein
VEMAWATPCRPGLSGVPPRGCGRNCRIRDQGFSAFAGGGFPDVILALVGDSGGEGGGAMSVIPAGRRNDLMAGEEKGPDGSAQAETLVEVLPARIEV